MKPPCFFSHGIATRAGGEHRAGVEVHDAVVLLVGQFGIGHAAEHAAGIVDQPVEPAEMLRASSSTTRVDVGGDREIALDQEYLAACRLRSLRPALRRRPGSRL